MSNNDEVAIINCGTTKGDLEIHLFQNWSPHGYNRATELFERGFYDHSHFFRVVPHFLVQFGISYSTDEDLQALARSTIPDDPKFKPQPIPFAPGIMSYAGSGPNSRNSQLFISYGSADSLGRELWETPIGKVVNDGVNKVAAKFYSYGDMPPWGHGPEQGPIHNQGSSYIEHNFPKIDKFNTCTVRRIKKDHPNAVESGNSNNQQQREQVKDDTKNVPKVEKPQENIPAEEQQPIIHHDASNVETVDANRVESLRKSYNRELQALKEKMPDDSHLNVFVVALVVFLFICSITLIRRSRGKKVTDKDY